MIPSNVDYALTEVFKTIESKNIHLEFLEEDIYVLHSNDSQNFFKIFLKIFSTNRFCFNIIREQIDLIKVEIYENSIIKTLNFHIGFDEDISPKQEQYANKINRLKKQRIFPVIGPDGVGKTTLLTSTIDINEKEIVYKRFKKIVRRSIIYNLVYPINRIFLKRKLGFKPQKDQYDDKNYLLILIAGAMYYPYLIFMARFKNKIVFVDRFFNDYFFKNISFLDKKTKLRKNWKNLLGIVPEVFWQIHLDAKPNIILGRKDELKKRDIKKYKKFNFKIYLAKPSYIYTYINTGLDIDNCKEFLEYTYNKVLEKND